MGFNLCIFCLLLAVHGALAEVSIRLTPDTLPSSGSKTTIAWSGVSSPSVHDKVIFYGVKSDNEKVLVGYVNVTTSSSWKQGEGQYVLPLVNMRVPYLFEYEAEGNVLANASLAFDDFSEPLFRHLSLTNDPTEMTISWVTNQDTSTSQEGGYPIVIYGTDPNNMQAGQYESRAETFVASDMCGAPANLSEYFLDPGYLHVATLTGLEPNTVYYYSVGVLDGEKQLWTPIESFVSSPGVGPDVPVKSFLFGDMGIDVPFTTEVLTEPPSSATLYWMEQRLKKDAKSNWIVNHFGDTSYARGNSWIWEYFMQEIEPVASKIPYMVGIGNHDYDYAGMWQPSWSNYAPASGGECGVAYSKRFVMPQPDGSEKNMWYSYDFGSVHFVMMSTEHDFLPGSSQYAFLKKDLASVNRSITPWVIFMGHRPLYSSTVYGDTWGKSQMEHYRAAIEPLLHEYGVDLSVGGHIHQYERTCPMYNFICQDGLDNRTDIQAKKGYPVYIVAGMAGATAQSVWSMYASYHTLPPNWIVFRSTEYGLTFVEATSTTLTFQYVNDQDGAVHDIFSLHKGSDWGEID
eukprot:CAMPEP_0113871810 /NCGR_PEP_ID=MMETSP0780_2-20120614/2852_1 /TAXON_ID=652834 /ORGANISM="Palpitomonas bilix" /LENGTH=571 /DNA_ID=CAMNT_0000857247 /DNA_START=277 /DNA_END=1992 /DNA_ORIENTATION=- /assembly_acc=CAM_ASM_000599